MLGISAGLFAAVAGPIGVAQAVEMVAPRTAARWREARPLRVLWRVVVGMLKALAALAAISGLTSLAAYVLPD